MAKAPRPSIADQLASISASRLNDVTTQPRDDVKTDNRKRGSAPRDTVTSDHALHDKTEPDENASEGLPRGNLSRENAKRGRVTPEGFRIRQRVEKPHVSLYAHPRVLKKVREIAAAEDCKAHDIYIEGLRLVLAKYGLDFDKLDRGEG